MKHEWRKHEKNIYLPKKKPLLINIPEMSYFTIVGEGNPNSDNFAKYIEVLYQLSYAIRMSYKSNDKHKDYYEYTVYPLEGVWDINDEAKKVFTGKINKDDLVYDLMIRQPTFVDPEYANYIKDKVLENKKNSLVEKVKFKTISEGQCVQMLHLGSYDNEALTFDIMENFCKANNLVRVSKIHREIYLTDARKTAPDKLKTVLRFNVK